MAKLVKSAALAAAIILSVVACGDHPVPEHGTITNRDHSGPYMQYCGKGCFIYHPDEWRVEVTDLHNPDWSGSVEVSHEDFDKRQMRDLWPDCAKS